MHLVQFLGAQAFDVQQFECQLCVSVHDAQSHVLIWEMVHTPGKNQDFQRKIVQQNLINSQNSKVL